MKRACVLCLLFYFWLTLAVCAEVVYSLDFSERSEGNAASWLEDQGFNFKIDADELSLQFKSGRLVLGNSEKVNGLLYKEIELKGVKRVRIEWGIQRFPKGIDWENDNYRDAVMLIVSFGTEKISSGSFVVPNLPYFMGIFLDQKAVEGKSYTGSYYKKGGRYFCYPCQIKEGETVVSDFELHERFKSEFNQNKVPPVTAFAIESDTRDTEGAAEAYIKKIEFLSD